MTFSKAAIVGMGYVGLTLAVVMAEVGYDVVGLEINPETLKSLEGGAAHFFEVGLNDRLARQLRKGKLRFTSDAQDEALREAEVFIITVGTPLGPDGVPRMDMVQRAAGEVAAVMREDALVVLRSTVKLGTTRNVARPVLEASGKKYRLAYCPERTLEGKALEELRHLPQVVGGLEPEHAWAATQVFQRITPTTIRVSTLETAELVKLLDNSYRDLFFSFGNEVALLCEAAGLDGMEVINAANTGYERTAIARPGLVGGPCLEKDPHILRLSTEQYGFTPKLIATGRQLNTDLPTEIMGLVDKALGGGLPENAKIAVCGLAFKGRPETDDLRGTPAKYLVEAVRQRYPHAHVVGQDFAVSDAGIESMGLEPADIDAAFKDTHLVLISNNNAKYQRIELDRLVATMARPSLVFDIWDVLQTDRAGMPEGVRYVRLGSSTAWSKA